MARIVLCLVVLPATLVPATSRAQSPAAPAVALVGVAFDGTYANSIQPGDSATAAVAAERMRGALRESPGITLLDTARVSAVVARTQLPNIACSTDAACARRVGQSLGARWVVVGSLRKVSNLIWYLSGQLIDVESGRVALSDEFELKGQRDEMVPRGAASLARRVARVASGETSESATQR